MQQEKRGPNNCPGEEPSWLTRTRVRQELMVGDEGMEWWLWWPLIVGETPPFVSGTLGVSTTRISFKSWSRSDRGVVSRINSLKPFPWSSRKRTKFFSGTRIWREILSLTSLRLDCDSIGRDNLSFLGDRSRNETVISRECIGVEGTGTERQRKGSKVFDVLPQDLQVKHDFSCAWNRSWTKLRWCLRWLSRVSAATSSSGLGWDWGWWSEWPILLPDAKPDLIALGREDFPKELKEAVFPFKAIFSSSWVLSSNHRRNSCASCWSQPSYWGPCLATTDLNFIEMSEE